eukprot:1088040-Pleurochrysis_carterae.AAC.1
MAKETSSIDRTKGCLSAEERAQSELARAQTASGKSEYEEVKVEPRTREGRSAGRAQMTVERANAESALVARVKVGTILHRLFRGSVRAQRCTIRRRGRSRSTASAARRPSCSPASPRAASPAIEQSARRPHSQKHERRVKPARATSLTRNRSRATVCLRAHSPPSQQTFSLRSQQEQPKRR